MITKKSENYRDFFDKINKEYGTSIADLSQYFENFQTILQGDIDKEEAKGKRFSRLPLDEEYFEIDANKRTITVPNSFKNGVSVQGDIIAEIVYFRIDRYFDSVDLKDMDARIEWKIKGDTGLSKAYMMDIESEEGYVIFGWPIRQELTEFVGEIEFAVRFYKKENDKIIYSFSTQPAKVKILQGLLTGVNDDSLLVDDSSDDSLEIIKKRAGI